LPDDYGSNASTHSIMEGCPMKIRSIITVVCLVSVFISCLILHADSAETKTFIKEYTYQAGDEDSKNSCRVIALREVKRLLLEELG
jgi:hypothetical protein